MKRLLALGLAILSLLAAPLAPAFASPLPYINSPLDTPQALVNSLISSINLNQPEASYITFCSGTTTATCQGLRLQVSITGLSTGASGTSATMTVTDTLVTAASQIFCQMNGYGGAGQPLPTTIVPGAGSFTVAVQNVSTTAALNATVPIECLVLN